MRSSPGPSSLDPRQKNDDNPSPERLNRLFTFSYKAPELAQLESIIDELNLDTKKKNRLQGCGTQAWLDYSPSSRQFRCRSNHCGLRMCPRCRSIWAQRLRVRMSHGLESIKPGRRKLITLTQRSSTAPLGTQINHLWSAFRKLRQRTIWRQGVTGCFAVLEITYNEEKAQWHPHLHLAADASYIDQKALSNQWLQVTAGSKIVDIRAIRSTSQPAKYLTSYLTKPPDFPQNCRKERMTEYYAALDNHHTFRSYGTLRPSCLESGEEPDDYPDDWVQIGSIADLITRAASGDVEAINNLEAYHAQRHPLSPDDQRDGP